MRAGIVVALGLAAALPGCKNDQQFVPATMVPPIGEPPPPDNPIREDRILQVNEPAVDVLFVIDNSCSMLEEQVSLAVNFPAFLAYFLDGGLNYHIGVVSTDMEHPFHTGQLRESGGYRYLDRHTVNPAIHFAQMVQLGTGGWFEERGRDAVFTALDLRVDDEANAGFYRPGATLHAVFVSDEDDQSLLITRDEFDQWSRDLKWSPDQVTYHAIVAPNLEGDCFVAIEPGFDYLHYVGETGGSQFSICAADWEPMLDTLGVQASGLRREYFLTRLPVPDTIEVRIEDVDEDGALVVLDFIVCQAHEQPDQPECQVMYVPSRNSVVFLDYVPNPLAEVVVTYHLLEEFAADPTAAPGGQ